MRKVSLFPLPRKRARNENLRKVREREANDSQGKQGRRRTTTMGNFFKVNN